MSHQDLNQAKKAKKNEFYTQLSDIEKELKHYKHHFKDKIVYCNCDDPKVSNFFKYFTRNFEHLGLKQVIATCYKNQLPLNFTEYKDERACYMIYEGDKNKNRIVDDYEIKEKLFLKGDGDFRSKESVEFLKEADIVCTNPPFSLFNEYIKQLIQYEKKFLIIGNINAASNKEIFPLIKENKIWLGPSISSGDREFQVPKHYSLQGSSVRIDKKGRKFIRVKGVRWFTNLKHSKRNDKLHLIENYSPEKFPTYDNYNAIEVRKVVDIPKKWGGQWVFPLHF